MVSWFALGAADKGLAPTRRRWQEIQNHVLLFYWKFKSWNSLDLFQSLLVLQHQPLHHLIGHVSFCLQDDAVSFIAHPVPGHLSEPHLATLREFSNCEFQAEGMTVLISFFSKSLEQMFLPSPAASILYL